jgi:hypothetical protein
MGNIEQSSLNNLKDKRLLENHLEKQAGLTHMGRSYARSEALKTNIGSIPIA